MGWYVAGVAKLRDVCRGSCIYSLAFDVIQHLFLTTGQLSLILPLPCPWHDKYEVSSLVFTDIQWWCLVVPRSQVVMDTMCNQLCLSCAPPSSGTIPHASSSIVDGFNKKNV